MMITIRLYTLLALVITLNLSLHIQAIEQAKKFDTKLFTDICSSKPKLNSSRDHQALQWLLQKIGKRSIQSRISHQHKAACWILHDDGKKISVGKAFVQRYALAVLYYATQGEEYWKEDTNWMSSKSECQWYGVECNFLGTVISLDLGFNDLNGILPRELSFLPKLKDVDLHGNDLQGVIPPVILNAWRDCKILRLHMNGFFGEIPTQIGTMTSLEELHLFGNYFGGTVPTELENLNKLKILDLYANALEGSVPSQIGNLKKLKELDVHDNFLDGKVPDEICDRNLSSLVADCLEGEYKEISCDCCNICCEGLPNMRCIDQESKEEINWIKAKV